MYCPNCGASEQSAQTDCRKCGKWIGSSPPEERLTVMILFNALKRRFGVISAIALFARYLGSPTAQWSIYLAATSYLIISAYQTLSFFLALNIRRRLKQGRSEVES